MSRTKRAILFLVLVMASMVLGPPMVYAAVAGFFEITEKPVGECMFKLFVGSWIIPLAAATAWAGASLDVYENT